MSLDIVVNRKSHAITFAELRQGLADLSTKYPGLTFVAQKTPPPPVLLVFGSLDKAEDAYEINFWETPKAAMYLSHHGKDGLESSIVITSNSRFSDYMEFVSIELAKLLGATASYIDSKEDLVASGYDAQVQYHEFLKAHQ